MKFCPECGTKFDQTAKFCAECGKKRVDTAENDVKSPELKETVTTFSSWLKKYKPVKHPAAKINEAFGGMFIPAFGVMADWIMNQDSEFVWSLECRADLNPMACRSGYWTGPGIIGYFLCSERFPSAEDNSFDLPEHFVSLGAKLILMKDGGTKKWRPCHYELLGDSTSQVSLKPTLAEVEDSLEAASTYNFQLLERQRLQVTMDISGPEAETLLDFGDELDARYFFASPESLGSDGFFLNEYVNLDAYRLEYDGELEGISVLGRPISSLSDTFYTTTSLCECEIDCDCEPIAPEGNYFGSFMRDSKYRYFQFSVALDAPIQNEQEFRLKTLSKLFTRDKNRIDELWHFAEKDFSMFAEEPWTLAFDRKNYAYKSMVKQCEDCAQFNPKIAQVCFSCCSPFVEQISGQLFACIRNDIGKDPVDKISAKNFSEWANIYFFVAPAGTAIPYPIKVDAVYGY